MKEAETKGQTKNFFDNKIMFKVGLKILHFFGCGG
jgi:hypothetical protein